MRLSLWLQMGTEAGSQYSLRNENRHWETDPGLCLGLSVRKGSVIL